MSCACDTNKFDDGTACVDFVTCADGTYTDLSTNTCLACGENCQTCTYETGMCNTCTEGDYVVNGQTCELYDPTCNYEYGPVSDPVGCVSEMYSADRLLAPYADTTMNVDWRDWGIVNEIRDQGSCGSCWAFMSVAAAETHYAIKYGPLFELSEQQLVSCDSNNSGC